MWWCLFWFPVAFLSSQNHNTVCVYAKLDIVNVFYHSGRWAVRLVVYLWTDERGGQSQEGSWAGVLSFGGHKVKHTLPVAARGRWWKLGKPRLTPSRTRSTQVAGCPEVEVSVLRNHSLCFRVANLYIWRHGIKKVAALELQLELLLIHCNGSVSSRSTACVCARALLCVCCHKVTHMLAESHFPVTPLPRSLAGCNSGF